MSLSFDEITSKISQAVYEGTQQTHVPYYDWYVLAVYPDYAIIRMYNPPNSDLYFKVPYTMDGETLTLPARNDWEQVERAWVAKSIANFNAFKTISKDDNWLRVGNYIVMYGERDLTNVLSYDPVRKSFAVNPKGKGEFFTKSTVLESPYTDTGILHMDIEHGLSKLLDGPDAPGEDDVVGFVDWRTAQKSEKGTWVEQALNRRNQYIQALEPLIELGIVGTSSEAVPELVEIDKNGEIKKWGLKRNTLSFMSADPRMMDQNTITALKSLADRYPALKAILPQDGGDPSEGDTTADPSATQQTNFATLKETNMGDNTQTTDPGARLDAIETMVENFSKSLASFTEALEKMPALNSAGYKTDDGGKADPTHKSFGDYLLAVKRKDETRLKSVYRTQKDISGETGESGGWLVPPDMSSELLRVAEMADPITSRVDVIPVTKDSGTYPALDQFVAPTAGAGQTAFAGGVKATATGAGASLTETQPTFAQLQWRLHKIGGYVEVENEVGEDAPMLEALLRSLFAIAIGSRNHRNILRGNGAGEPEGILNAACAIGVATTTNNVFSYSDSLNMLSRFKSVGGQPVWIMHPGVLPDVGVMEIGTAGAGAVFLANGGGGSPSNLHGYPILISEHMPQANGDDVILADLKGYKFWQRGAIAVAFSEHAAFTNDKGTWRFTQRNDGKAWLKSPITLADPTGSYTVSPFVYHDD